MLYSRDIPNSRDSDFDIDARGISMGSDYIPTRAEF